MGRVISATVETLENGELLARWVVTGAPTPVRVATGLTPDVRQHHHTQTVAAGLTSLRIAARPEERRFVSIAAEGDGSVLVTADRRVAFEGVQNFRDLGGYTTLSGGHLRWGILYRADALHALSERDEILFRSLKVRKVYDLRSQHEIELNPNRVPSEHSPIASRPRVAASTRLSDVGETLEAGEKMLADLYRRIIDDAATNLGRLYTDLAQPGNLPAVIQCQVGKDRTGLAIAILLEAIGVTRETILDDYELRTVFGGKRQPPPVFDKLLELGLTREAAAGVLTAPRWAMRQALDYITISYGTVDSYLTGRAGMSLEDLETLRAALVDGCRADPASRPNGTTTIIHPTSSIRPL